MEDFRFIVLVLITRSINLVGRPYEFMLHDFTGAKILPRVYFKEARWPNG